MFEDPEESSEFEDTPFEAPTEEVELTPAEKGELAALAGAEDVISAEDQVLPEEVAVTDPLQLILIAIANYRHIQIVYTNRRGEMKEYVLEPYEIGGNKSHPSGYLWGYDINVDTIKSFFLANVYTVDLLETFFVPRY